MARRIAFAAILTSVALALSGLEAAIPGIGLPGVKLGLANLPVVIALYLFGPLPAAIISLARAALGALLFGGGASAIYSLVGAGASVCAMAALYKSPRLSAVGVSAAGGWTHNFMQLAIAAALTRTSLLGAYFPLIAVSGLLTGMLNGYLARLILPKLLIFKFNA